jgi:hypothetical protein
VVSLREEYLEERKQYIGEKKFVRHPEEMFRHISHMLNVCTLVVTNTEEE